MAARTGNCYRLGTNQVVSFTSTSVANTTAFQTGINTVRVVASTHCHIAFGSSPTATTSSAKLPANAIEYFVVTPGQKIAAIRTTTSGTLHVTECSG
jgi:ABC-type taurine transport system substrate-binding protein